ncbi:MAG: hypothetical protein GX663_06730 [Clostridiales bacterium]|nr:hypothetical protein [Clostridiales bacterium]
MANNKEGWRKLVNQIPKTKSLSHKWLNNQPTIEGFHLEDYNLNSLYKSKMRFEDDKEFRSEELRKNLPAKNPRASFSWEGYIAILFMMGMVAYQVFSNNPTYVVFGFLAIGSMVFFFLYYYRLRKKQINLKKQLEKISERQRRIDREEYEYEEAYSSLVRYARAIYDYEAWERRRNPSSWKKFSDKMFQSELISMFKTFGYDSDFAEKRDMSMVYEGYDDERCAVLCVTGKEAEAEEVIRLVKAMERNRIKEGMVVALKGYTKEAAATCQDKDIEMWSLDDVIKFEKEIELQVKKEVEESR